MFTYIYIIISLSNHTKISFFSLQTLIFFLGNYTVKVTVTDKDQTSDSALATIMVIEEPDYPPTANAGEDLIIYLPKNKVIN